MSKFDRIVREALVMGGQARIRDTNITVNEIVRLSLEGKSQVEILEQFPQLDAEDVHQAMAFGLSETGEGLGIWRSETVQQISGARGYAKLLIDKDKLKITEETEVVLNTAPWIIQEYSNRAAFFNSIMSHWFQVNFRRYTSQETYFPFPMSIAELLVELNNQLEQDGSKLHPNYEIDEDITSLMVDVEELLPDVIIFLMMDYGGEHRDSPTITIIQSGDNIIFKIERLHENTDKILSYFEQPTMFQMANLMIYQRGSELTVQHNGDKVIFEFALPIVDDE